MSSSSGLRSGPAARELRLERHAADAAGAGLRLDDLGVHRADPLRRSAGRRRRGRRGGGHRRGARAPAPASARGPPRSARGSAGCRRSSACRRGRTSRRAPLAGSTFIPQTGSVARRSSPGRASWIREPESLTPALSAARSPGDRAAARRCMSVSSSGIGQSLRIDCTSHCPLMRESTKPSCGSNCCCDERDGGEAQARNLVERDPLRGLRLLARLGHRQQALLRRLVHAVEAQHALVGLGRGVEAAFLEPHLGAREQRDDDADRVGLRRAGLDVVDRQQALVDELARSSSVVSNSERRASRLMPASVLPQAARSSTWRCCGIDHLDGVRRQPEGDLVRA